MRSSPSCGPFQTPVELSVFCLPNPIFACDVTTARSRSPSMVFALRKSLAPRSGLVMRSLSGWMAPGGRTMSRLRLRLEGGCPGIFTSRSVPSSRYFHKNYSEIRGFLMARTDNSRFRMPSYTRNQSFSFTSSTRCHRRNSHPGHRRSTYRGPYRGIKG